MAKRSESEYREASDGQLVEWANAGDEEALTHVWAVLHVISWKKSENPAQGLAILTKLSPAFLAKAEGPKLTAVAHIYDRLERMNDALQWYLKATELGEADAGFYAGVIEEDRENYAKAFQLYKTSADRGDKEGQYMTAIYLRVGRGCQEDAREAYRYMKLSADQGDLDANKKVDEFAAAAAHQGSGPCIVATACIGDERVAPLRRLRDVAMIGDPLVRDFLHVFWSRYYEWSPGVARVAGQDHRVAEHLRWSFLSPWLSWIELVTLTGARSVEELLPAEREEVLRTLTGRIASWLEELPSMMEGKEPEDPERVREAFERFRSAALEVVRSGAWPSGAGEKGS